MDSQKPTVEELEYKISKLEMTIERQRYTINRLLDAYVLNQPARYVVNNSKQKSE